MDIVLRPASEADREFLYELHCDTMRRVIEETWGWDDSWQRNDFERRVHECNASIIEVRGRAVGGLLLEPKPDSIYIYEIQVASEHQRQGIGTTVIQQILNLAERDGVAVTLSVTRTNPLAKQLHERLGFEVTGFEEPFFRMRHNGRGESKRHETV